MNGIVKGFRSKNEISKVTEPSRSKNMASLTTNQSQVNYLPNSSSKLELTPPQGILKEKLDTYNYPICEYNREEKIDLVLKILKEKIEEEKKIKKLKKKKNRNISWGSEKDFNTPQNLCGNFPKHLKEDEIIEYLPQYSKDPRDKILSKNLGKILKKSPVMTSNVDLMNKQALGFLNHNKTLTHYRNKSNLDNFKNLKPFTPSKTFILPKTYSKSFLDDRRRTSADFDHNLYNRTNDYHPRRLSNKNKKEINPLKKKNGSSADLVKKIMKIYKDEDGDEFSMLPSFKINSYDNTGKVKEVKKEIRKFRAQHLQCGENCEHLDRFYQRVETILSKRIASNGMKRIELRKINFDAETFGKAIRKEFIEKNLKRKNE